MPCLTNDRFPRGLRNTCVSRSAPMFDKPYHRQFSGQAHGHRHRQGREGQLRTMPASLTRREAPPYCERMPYLERLAGLTIVLSPVQSRSFSASAFVASEGQPVRNTRPLITPDPGTDARSRIFFTLSSLSFPSATCCDCCCRCWWWCPPQPVPSSASIAEHRGTAHAAEA